MKPGDAVPPPGRVIRLSTRLSWWREVVLVGVLYGAYELQRGTDHADAHAAVAHGRSVLSVERMMHLAPESALNHGLSHVTALAVVAAYFYATLHYLVTPAVLVWLYRQHPGHYRLSRSSLAVGTAIGLVAFHFFPTAPPRLLPGADVADTLASVHRWGWWGGEGSVPRGLGSLTDQFAAMPSLHVGWALWAGVLVARFASRRWIRVLGVLYPVGTVAVVVATGNHYLLDAVAGAATMLVGAALARAGSSLAPALRGLARSVRRIRPVPALVAAVLVVEVALLAPHLQRGLGQVAHARPHWLLAAVLAETASIIAFSRLQRVMLITAGIPVRLRDAIAATLAANALSVTLPGGSLVAIAYTSRRMRAWGAGGPLTAFALAAGGVLSTLALALLATGGTAAHDAGQLGTALIPVAVIVLAAVIVLLILRRPALLRRIVSRPVARWQRLRPRAGQRTVDELLDAFASLRPSGRVMARGLAFALVNRVDDLICLLAACYAVGADPALGSVLLAYTVGMAAASAVPLLPAGLGPVDAALVLALHSGGTPTAVATGAVLIYRFVSLGMLGGAGWLVLLVQRRRSVAPSVTTPALTPVLTPVLAPARPRHRPVRRVVAAHPDGPREPAGPAGSARARCAGAARGSPCAR